MKTIIIVAGILVLLVGIGVMAYGLSSPTTSTSSSATTASVAVVPNTSRTISTNGFWAMGAASLVPGESVTGTVTVSNYSSSAGPIFVYVQNESSFIAWGACAPCGGDNQLNKSLSSSGSYTFTWTAPQAGSYYFVLDADYYNAAAPASFSANAVTTSSVQISQSSPNSTVNYGGVGVAVVGAIILGIGLILGTQTRKPPGS
jgi:hypothetical protein